MTSRQHPQSSPDPVGRCPGPGRSPGMACGSVLFQGTLYGTVRCRRCDYVSRWPEGIRVRRWTPIEPTRHQ